MYFVYILKSLKHSKTYVGISDDIERRLEQHNSGYHVYTKQFIPWKIVYKEIVESRTDARKREKYFKSSAGRKWMKAHIFC